MEYCKSCGQVMVEHENIAECYECRDKIEHEVHEDVYQYFFKAVQLLNKQKVINDIIVVQNLFFHQMEDYMLYGEIDEDEFRDFIKTYVDIAHSFIYQTLS